MIGVPYWVPMDVPVTLGRDEARRRALEELTKSKYGGEIPDWVRTLFDRLGEALLQLIDFIDNFGLLPGQDAGGISWPLLIVALVVLTGVVLIIWKVGLPRWSKRRADAALDLDSTRPPADYREMSEAAARAGDWTAAVRDRYRAVIRELEIRTILDPRPARTAWEAAITAAKTLPEVEAELSAGADLFNAVMYGDQTAEQSDYQQMSAYDAAITRQADSADLSEAEPAVGVSKPR